MPKKSRKGTKKDIHPVVKQDVDKQADNLSVYERMKRKHPKVYQTLKTSLEAASGVATLYASQKLLKYVKSHRDNFMNGSTQQKFNCSTYLLELANIAKANALTELESFASTKPEDIEKNDIKSLLKKYHPDKCTTISKDICSNISINLNMIMEELFRKNPSIQQR
jgi:hypothetical protein